MTKNLYILTGASRGMGLAMAQQLLQAGHSVLCISRQTNAELEPLAQTSGAHLTQWSQDLAQGVAASERLGGYLDALGAYGLTPDTELVRDGRWMERNAYEQMRELLETRLVAAGIKSDVSFITRQKGMFSYTGLTAPQMQRLRNEFGVYGVDSGRICVAALNTGNIDKVVQAISAVG